MFYDKIIFIERAEIQAKHSEKRGRNKVDSHEVPLRKDREG